MMHEQFIDKGRTFSRVSKLTAKRLLKEGFIVWCCPLNFRRCTTNMFIMKPDDDFEIKLNHIWYYNCSNEAGKYLVYFVKVSDIVC